MDLNSILNQVLDVLKTLQANLKPATKQSTLSPK